MELHLYATSNLVPIEAVNRKPSNATWLCAVACAYNIPENVGKLERTVRFCRPDGQYAIDPKVDPAIVTPVAGN